MKIKWEHALLDADFSLKLGIIENVNAIEEYVGNLVGKVYIHRHIYDTEILTPRRVKQQIDTLISQGKAEIVDLSTLPSELEKNLYNSTITILANADPLTKKNGKNWGETVSLAYAKTSGIPYFLSDEKDLQAFADEHLNTDLDEDVKIIRIRDFILAMKEAGYTRKETQFVWLVANFDSTKRDESSKWAKEVFKNQLWPPENN